LIKKITSGIDPSMFNPFSYMGRTVNNIIADILKGKYKYPNVSFDDFNSLNFDPSDDSWNALVDLEKEHDENMLKKCLEELKESSPHGWEIIKLRYYEGMRLVEISRHLNENENTTRSIHKRSLASLWKCIEKCEKN
jgi:RNA polymerase sigma factor (sigma-70 family)